MTDKCYDIGTMQAFLDGELRAEMTEAVARHVSLCDDCARLLAESEEESALAFSALEYELNALVPTQRLWTKINDSIAREKKSFWKPIFASLLQPQTAAFASLIFVALVSVTLLSLKPDAPANYTARQTGGNQQKAIQPAAQNSQTLTVQPTQDLPVERDAEPATFRKGKIESRAVKTVYVEPKNNQRVVNPPMIETKVEAPPVNENVSGEESYIRTIATLDSTVANRKDEVLSPSARFAFERDLAVTDDAIEQMKREVRKNPKNEAAKQILRASYQNKIDLLNSVADKTELMASLK